MIQALVHISSTGQDTTKYVLLCLSVFSTMAIFRLWHHCALMILIIPKNPRLSLSRTEKTPASSLFAIHETEIMRYSTMTSFRLNAKD